MLQKRNLLLVFSAILSLFLVACGASADGDGDAQSVSLEQSVSYEDELGGTVSINYPDGWVSNTDNGSINLASTEELLAAISSGDTPEPESGQILATVLVIPPDMAAFFIAGGEEASPVAIVNSFAADMIEDGESINEVEEITIDGSAAAYVKGNTDGVDIALVAVDIGDGNYALVIGGTADGEADSIRAIIEAMAGSLSYEAGESE